MAHIRGPAHERAGPLINRLSLGVGLFVVHVGLVIIPIAGETPIVAVTVPIANFVIAIRLELHVVTVAIVIPGHELIAVAP